MRIIRADNKASTQDKFDLPSDPPGSHRSEVESANTQQSNKKEFGRLWSLGIRLLSMREHSQRELADKLCAKTTQGDIVYAVIDDLIEKNYQSDQRFTESFVRSRINRGAGPVKIKSELKGKGIENNLVDEFVDLDSAVWLENAERQYSKKYGVGPVMDYSAWTKRARFLQSRGFSMEHIKLTIPAIDND